MRRECRCLSCERDVARPVRETSYSFTLVLLALICVLLPLIHSSSGTQEEAVEAYDIAAIKFRGLNDVTNFDITRYDVDWIMSSNTLLAGELAKRNKKVVSVNEIINSV